MNSISVVQIMTDIFQHYYGRPNTLATRNELEDEITEAIDRKLEEIIGYPPPFRICPEVEQAEGGIELTDLLIVPKAAATERVAVPFNKVIGAELHRQLEKGGKVHLVAIFTGKDEGDRFTRGKCYHITLQRSQRGGIVLHDDRAELIRHYQSEDAALKDWRAIRSWYKKEDGGDGHAKE